jgi:division protein CdvB (Snf7/Vps24/ESCRT-III family)
MVQVIEKLENEAIYLVIPVIEEKAKKIKEKPEQIKKRLKFRNHAKIHQEHICIDKMKKKVDSSIYRSGFYNR